MGRALYSLAKMKLADSRVNNAIAKRIKLYWSEMLNQIKLLDVEKRLGDNFKKSEGTSGSYIR